MRAAASHRRALSHQLPLRPTPVRVRARVRACVCAIGDVATVRSSMEQLVPHNAWKWGVGGEEHGFADVGERRNQRCVCGGGVWMGSVQGN